LFGGRWADSRTLGQDAGKQRAALIGQLVAHSAEKRGRAFFEEKPEDELIGMAAAVVYLLGHGERSRAQLRTYTTDSHRNTMIYVMKTLEMEERAKGDQPRLSGKTEADVVKWLQGRKTKELVELATRDRPWVRLAIPPLRGADALNSPNFSPGESFSEVNRQHYGKEKVTDDEAKRPPGMKGFVKDYVHVLRHDRKCPDEQIVRYAHQVMQSFTPDQLPVLNGLARHYAVSDMWFSSVPSQTNTNRAFAFCGTSNGMVNNGFLEEGDKAKPIEELVGYKLGDDRVRAKTIFNALADDGKTTWKL
jgi:hypothetical protein